MSLSKRTAHVFPGQGAQFSGMGEDLYTQYSLARDLFAKADEILGYSLSHTMFHGTDTELKQTKITQPAVFLHAYISYRCRAEELPDMVAGHSLGEFTALAVNQTLTFEDALRLVRQRALAMQKACEKTESGMAVVLQFDHSKIEEICASISDEIVVPANYNHPEQLVIAGSRRGLDKAVNLLQKAGARRIMMLPVGGAFHSPLMQSAQDELASAIENCTFHTPICPIYQNVIGKSSQDISEIKNNLLAQLTHPVLWITSVQNMITAGATNFVEFGPGKTLQGLIKKINHEVMVSGR